MNEEDIPRDWDPVVISQYNVPMLEGWHGLNNDETMTAEDKIFNFSKKEWCNLSDEGYESVVPSKVNGYYVLRQIPKLVEPVKKVKPIVHKAKKRLSLESFNSQLDSILEDD